MKQYFTALLLLFFFCALHKSTPARIDEQGNSLIGFPVIKNYLPKDYKGHNQNWAIAQDKRGVLFFGNSNGLLEFDGQVWNFIQIPHGVVRSLACDKNGTLFIGSADDFGLLKSNPNGTYYFSSLLQYIPKDISFGHVWYTHAIGNDVFFVTSKYIFRFYNFDSGYKNPAVEIIKSKERFRIAHRTNDELYVLELAEGLLKWNGKALEHIPGSEFLAQSTIYTILPYNPADGSLLIGNKTGNFYLYRNNKFEPFITGATEYVKKYGIYLPGARLPDNTFAINTISGGVIIINMAGKILRIINSSMGLPDDGVLYTLYTNNKLWLALQNGISVLDLPSPVSFFSPVSGLKGSVSEAKIINGVLYALTTAGVYKLKLQQDNPNASLFTPATNLNNEAWAIARYKNSVLAVLTQGVFLIEGEKQTKLNTQWNNSYCIYISKNNPGIVFVGLEDGLGILEEKNGVWTDKGKLPGVATAIRTIAEDNKGNVWLGTTYNGLYKVEYKSDANSAPAAVTHFTNNQFSTTKEIKISECSGGLLFSTPSEVLQYNYSTGVFEKETRFGLNAYLNGAELIYLLEDKEGNLWIAGLNKKPELSIAVGKRTGSGTYEWKNLSFLKSVIDFSNSNAVFSILKDETTGNVFYCGADGIVQFSSQIFFGNTIAPRLFNPEIRRVLLNRDSLVFAGAGVSSVLLPYNFSSLRIEFSSMNYDGDLSLYKYKLEGLDDDWSDWQTETKKDYNSLPPGSYIFKVKFKDIYERESAEASFRFTIQRPWYLAWYAYSFYLLLLAGLVYAAFRLRFRYLINRNLRLEQIIAERTRLISNQAEKLKELDEIKSRFFTNISHEFRTPLTLILGQIESILSGNPEKLLRKKLEMGHRNARKVLQLINQLLEISKIEAGKYTLNIAPVNITAQLKRMLYTFESVADKKALSLEFYSEHNEMMLWCDIEKIERVFNNLFSNAVKFSQEGGTITVKVSREKELSLEERDLICVEVRDTGIGIPGDRLAFIFDRFYQIDREGRSEIEGTGIGLTLVKELLELHKASIEVESEPGKGTVFTVSFLEGKAHFAGVPEVVQKEKSPEQNNELDYEDTIYSAGTDDADTFEMTTEKDTVLVIDDNSDIRQFIREQLEDVYLVNEAPDGETGIKVATESIPTLIITDVRMPGMDGFELSRKLKENPLTCHIPIIILTAKADEADKLTGLSTGADDYLVKPFSPQELQLRVRNLISVRTVLREKYSKNRTFVSSEITGSSVEQKLLDDILTCINKNLSDEKFTAEILAKSVSISLSQLNRKLNALLGQPAGQLIRTVRMEKAAQLLSSGQVSIKEAGYSVGYGDQSNFARSFKKHFGKTPGEFTEQK